MVPAQESPPNMQSGIAYCRNESCSSSSPAEPHRVKWKDFVHASKWKDAFILHWDTTTYKTCEPQSRQGMRCKQGSAFSILSFRYPVSCKAHLQWMEVAGRNINCSEVQIESVLLQQRPGFENCSYQFLEDFLEVSKCQRSCLIHRNVITSFCSDLPTLYHPELIHG